MSALSKLSSYLDSLKRCKKWVPDGGSGKIKKIWDGKQFNLRYFANYPYVVICGDENEVYFYLNELDNEENVQDYWKHNKVGQGCFRIFETATGTVVAEWYSRELIEKGRRENRCDI
jgi:hypothetical protein